MKSKNKELDFMERKALDIKEIQSVSYEILRTIKRICDQENLKYVLAWGTLLGAIRHKGYIPWDDDVDIMMPRPDFEKLMLYFDEHKRELQPYEPLNLQKNQDYPYMLPRIIDNRYILETTNEKECGMGIFVDIYVLDGAGKTIDEAIQKMNTTKKYPSFIFLASRIYLHKGNTKGFLRLILKPFAFFYAKWRGKQFFVNKLLSKIDKTNYDCCDYVANLEWGTIPFYEVMNKKSIEERILVDFEGEKFYAPKNYDEILTKLYGDYMTPPPIKNRIYHHLYKAYLKSDIRQ